MLWGSPRFSSGAVSSRNTRRVEHPAEARRKLGKSSAKAPRKLRGSSAHPQLCSTLYESRSGYSLKVALTLEKLEIYDSQDPNAWLMTKTTIDAWIMNDDDDWNHDDHVVHRSTSSTVNSSSLIIIDIYVFEKIRGKVYKKASLAKGQSPGLWS